MGVLVSLFVRGGVSQLFFDLGWKGLKNIVDPRPEDFFLEHPP